MQTMPEKWHRQRDHILIMLSNEALLSVLTSSPIIMLGLQVFPYMKVDCLCFGLIYEWPLELHSARNTQFNCFSG